MFFSKKQPNKKECKFFSEEEFKECSILNSYEKISPLKKIELTVDFFHFKWGKWTIKLLLWGLFVIFIGAILDFYFSKTEPFPLEVFGALQIWVGFILAIIATLFSIISMYLSFYNLELQKEAEKESRNFLEGIKDEIVEKVKSEVENQLNLIHKEMEDKFGKLEKSTQAIRESINKDKLNEKVKYEYTDADILKFLK